MTAHTICHHTHLTALEGDYRQEEQNPALLQLPVELISQIGRFVATGEEPVDAAKNALGLGRVCALTHVVVAKDPKVASVVKNGNDHKEAVHALNDFMRSMNAFAQEDAVQSTLEDLAGFRDFLQPFIR